MPEWCWAVVGAIGAPLVCFFWQAFLTREKTEGWGAAAGRALGSLLYQRLGIAGGQEVKARFCSTLDDFTSGIKRGLGEAGGGS